MLFKNKIDLIINILFDIISESEKDLWSIRGDYPLTHPPTIDRH